MIVVGRFKGVNSGKAHSQASSGQQSAFLLNIFAKEVPEYCCLVLFVFVTMSFFDCKINNVREVLLRHLNEP